MNYPESQLILGEIKKANRILLNCHRGPDSDSVGSALAMNSVLRKLGKETLVICPSEVPEDLKFLENSDDIKTVEFESFSFKDYDLFLTMDSSNYGMVSGNRELQLPDINIIVMDHHHTNVGFGSINLIDSNKTSTAELLFDVFKDWGINFDSEISTKLLTGIIGDTGCFQYAGAGKTTLDVAGQLLEFGANKDQIILNIYRSIEYSSIKFWGKVIESMQHDKEGRFVWSAIPNSVYNEYGADSSAKEDVSNLFAPVIKDTDFGVIMMESDKNVLSVSFRSRSSFDVSKIAKEVGGGGHVLASGAKVEGPFEEAVEKVLNSCRKYANKKE